MQAAFCIEAHKFINRLQNSRNHQTVSKRHENLFTAHALPRESGAYLAQHERQSSSSCAGSIMGMANAVPGYETRHARFPHTATSPEGEGAKSDGTASHSTQPGKKTLGKSLVIAARISR